MLSRREALGAILTGTAGLLGAGCNQSSPSTIPMHTPRTTANSDERPEQHLVDPEVRAAWVKGFEKRKGHELLHHMRWEAKDSGALQKYIDSLHLQEVLIVPPEIEFLCMEDRITEECGCSSAGSYAVAAGPDGKPRALTAEEIAQTISNSHIVRAAPPKKPVKYTKHKKGCGGDRLAKALTENKDPNSLTVSEIEEWGNEQGLQVQAALQKIMPGREVKYQQITLENSPSQGHPGQVIYIVDDEQRDLIRDYPKIPQGMQLDGFFLGNKNLSLHLSAGIDILLKHGPGRTPIMVMNLTDAKNFSSRKKWLKELEGQYGGQVLTGAAILPS